jgi:hypothetical protein
VIVQPRGPCWICREDAPLAEPFSVVDGARLDPAIKAPLHACDRHIPATDRVIGWCRPTCPRALAKLQRADLGWLARQAKVARAADRLRELAQLPVLTSLRRVNTAVDSVLLGVVILMLEKLARAISARVRDVEDLAARMREASESVRVTRRALRLTPDVVDVDGWLADAEALGAGAGRIADQIRDLHDLLAPARDKLGFANARLESAELAAAIAELTAAGVVLDMIAASIDAAGVPRAEPEEDGPRADPRGSGASCFTPLFYDPPQGSGASCITPLYYNALPGRPS